jgi:uncharacterized membrane protein YjgN (DUF898 family)
MGMTVINNAADAAAHERVNYAGRPGLVGLLSKNFFLMLVTLGIYRFWAATKLRRYLWSNIQIGGDALEYTGTGRELFLGFLIALAFLAPLSIAYAVSYRLALGNPLLAGAFQLTYFAVLIILLQVALFRSRRYRLSRTLWRGIYAGQSGSTWHYLWLFLGYGVLTVVTLGLALPWLQVALERYKLNHTWFGDHEMSIEAKGSALFSRWLVVMLCFWVPLLLTILPNLSLFSHLSQFKPTADGKPDPALLQLGGVVARFYLAIVLGGLAFVWYRIEAFRYLASRVKLGTMQLHSGAKGMTAVGRVLLYGVEMMGIMLGIMVVVGIGAAIVLPVVKASLAGQTIAPTALAAIVVAVLVPFYVLMGYVAQLTAYCWLWIPIIWHLASTLAIENFAAAQTISQSTQPRQKLGIADSFELGAF